jgi:nitrogen fixation/metabolism regulation signal transduction histidine kinase
VHSLRNRLIAAFVLATALPLAATIWITTTLIDRSLGYATTGELDHLSRTLEITVRQFYQRERETLKQDAMAGRAAATTFNASARGEWPEAIGAFWESGDGERFGLSGSGGDHVDYLRRTDGGVERFSRDLGGIRMEELSEEFRRTRELVGSANTRDLRRGFTLTLLLLLGTAWLVSLAPLIFLARRVSRPIQQLTAGLAGFASGDWSRRLEADNSGDEVGLAVAAFNDMADQLRQSRERLIYLTQIASWQSLARKTAHELKNSLTPIRLTVEEMLARQPPADKAFMEQAVQIVVSEIDSLERRVRAFSELGAEPPTAPEVLDLNSLVNERVALLRPAHPSTTYHLKPDAGAPRAYAGADLVKGILTNLLQNAAEAAGPDGSVLAVTGWEGDRVSVEVHDSGPGLSDAAASTLFEPTITFKKHGMGLGLSIAKKNALLAGGDIVPIGGALGGAAFKVTLPAAAAES